MNYGEKKLNKKRKTYQPASRDKNRPRSTKPDRRPRKDGSSDFQWKKAAKTLGFWVFLIIGSILLSQLFRFDDGGEQTVSYSQYLEFLEQNKITEAKIIDLEFHGILKNEETVQQGGKSIRFKYFKVLLPFKNEEMIKKWGEHKIDYDFKPIAHDWMAYFLTTLPWVILIVIWVFLLRRMQAGGTKGIFSFGKSRAKLLIENKPKITFDDVAGADEAKEELREIIDFLRDPGRFQKLGGKLPKGALLLGPPGTGKTLLARAIAGEANVPFFSMSGADFVEMFVGVGASRVRDLFEQGKKNAPCIIFIDEIDAVGRQRGAGLGGGHDEREQTLNQLLVEMDGFESNEGVIILAATNRPDVLDSALLRPGRFDRQIVVDRPDVKGRKGILEVHTRKIPLGKDVDLDVLAKGTPGLAGAELANLVNEAALLAARENHTQVVMDDFENAKDKVMMGTERKSLIISEQEKRQTAYHESGHVLVSKLIPESDPIHKVTIIPRGRALGITTSLPIDEKHTYSKLYCEALLAKMMGGRVAELIVFNELSTGAGNDIEQATNLARKMVCEWGMSEKLGPLTFGKKEEEIFLGREIAQHRDYSELTAQIIDQEVKAFVLAAQTRAEKIVRDNHENLVRLAEALLEREILDSEEIDALMRGEELKPVKNSKEDHFATEESLKEGSMLDTAFENEINTVETVEDKVTDDDGDLEEKKED